MPQGELSDRLWWPDSHGVHPLPIHTIDQSEQLSMVELHPMLTDPRPDKVRLLQPLAVQDYAGAVPPDDFDAIRPFGPEDVQSAAEGVGSSLAHQRQKPVRSFAEVDRMAGDKHLHTGRDHACRTARRILIKWF